MLHIPHPLNASAQQLNMLNVVGFLERAGRRLLRPLTTKADWAFRFTNMMSRLIEYWILGFCVFDELCSALDTPGMPSQPPQG
jgi:hypothetical protein